MPIEPTSAPTMRIGELANRFTLNPRTIRFYEDSGVLPPAERTDAGHRIYRDVDVERLRFVRTAQRFGFSLDEIREILAFRERGERPCGYVVGVLDRRVDQLGSQIAEMRALKTTLEDLRVRARDLPGNDDGYCEVIEHLTP